MVAARTLGATSALSCATVMSRSIVTASVRPSANRSTTGSADDADASDAMAGTGARCRREV